MMVKYHTYTISTIVTLTALTAGFSFSPHHHVFPVYASSKAVTNLSRRKISNNGRDILQSTSITSPSSPSKTNPPPPLSDEALFEPLGTGILRDVKRRLPYYKSDFLDGMNSQSIATILFLFFACLAPAIGFGGISDIATNGAMGTMEMVLSTALCGVIYGLFSTQPMILIGPMGPVLAFTISLAQIAKVFHLPFLPLYSWTGLWTSGMLFVSALTSTSNLVKYVTPFTDEIFTLLVSFIFILDAISDVTQAFVGNGGASKALMTLVCASITVSISCILKGLKQSIYWTKSIRNNLSNFAPAIGVAVGSLVARLAFWKYGAHVQLPALSLPVTFATTSGRPWRIPLMELPVWARWASIVPALLATLLLFLTQNITGRVVNNPRYQMMKGRSKGNIIDGMHGDLFLVSLLTALTSMLGLPWMVGATTRAAAHVRSLVVLDETDGSIQKILENRVSGTCIHAMIGACALFSGPRILLAQVPLPVLSGVFMYLGVSSLPGVQFWDRMKALFEDGNLVTPKKRWSEVSSNITKRFTMVQIMCLALMIMITKSKYGVISPLVIGFLPIVRFGLMKMGIVDKESMNILDP